MRTVLDDISPTDRFEALYRAHAGAVLAYCRRRDASGAEDALAETFLVAWRRLDDVPRHELPWLLGVARRVVANAKRADVRRDALRERAGLHALDAGHSVGMESPVIEALGRLTDSDREVLLLHAWDGLSAVEAAVVLDCSPVACRLRLYRARRRLERVLDEIGSEAASAPTRSTAVKTQGASE
jgi:RNA polymerase sigma-70 factor, ECF subfamily